MPPASPAPPSVSLTPLRRLLWLYLALWVFEGALRKWILPGQANILLVVRDPVLLLIYAMAFQKNVFPRSAFIGWIIVTGGMAFIVSFIATSTPMLVQIYGLRADFLHLPLIFVLPAVFDLDDVRAAGKWALWLAAPMAVLVMLQFRSPGGAYVNRGAGGGDVGGMLESAYGHIRPSGTFSFTNGLSGFTLLVAAFFLYHLLEKRVYPRLLWLAAAPSLLIMIVLSGSRTAVGAVALVLATVVFICFVQPRFWQSSFKLFAFAGLAVLALGSFAVFEQGLNVFTYRFVKSGGVQSGFIDRFLDTFAVPFRIMAEADPGGAGLGMGTNAAAGLITGKRTFMVAEGEFARVILESGPVVGMAYLGLRLAIDLFLGYCALRSLRERGNTLPALLFSACFIDVLQGQFAQPTGLGFATIAAGLCLAANRLPAKPSGAGAGDAKKPETPAATRPGGPAPGSPLPVMRGRSAFAAKMHGPSSADDAPASRNQ